MKQGELFPAMNGADKQEALSPQWRLFVDGASRGNPGPAGAGICLQSEGKEQFCEGYFLGTMTNNEAEYWALLLGLVHLGDHAKTGAGVEVCSDSQLLVRQLIGDYKVKKSTLRLLHQKALALLAPYQFSVRHVPREENKRADFLANRGIDTHKVVPEHLYTLVR